MKLKRCGICEKWMKQPDCPREVKGLKPSSEQLACDEFIKVYWAEIDEKEDDYYV